MEADYSVTSATGTERTVGDGTDVLIIVEHGTDDDLTFGNFDDLSIDGKTVSAENDNKENGSLKLTLKAAYLDTLSVGDHKVTISFTDGTVETSLKIKAAAPTPFPTPAPTPSLTPHPVLQTGDNDNPVLWIRLILLGIADLAVLVAMKASRKRK